MKLKYVGPFDEVEVPSLGLVVKRLGTVEIVGEPAQNLREQGDWEWVKPAAKAESQPTAEPAESMTEEKGEDVG
jgi:hypothetical protein